MIEGLLHMKDVKVVRFVREVINHGHTTEYKLLRLGTQVFSNTVNAVRNFATEVYGPNVRFKQKSDDEKRTFWIGVFNQHGEGIAQYAIHYVDEPTLLDRCGLIAESYYSLDEVCVGFCPPEKLGQHTRGLTETKESGLIRIWISKGQSNEQTFSTLFHELGHVHCIKNGLFPTYHNSMQKWTTLTAEERDTFYDESLKAEQFCDMWAERELSKHRASFVYNASYLKEENIRGHWMLMQQQFPKQ